MKNISQFSFKWSWRWVWHLISFSSSFQVQLVVYILHLFIHSSGVHKLHTMKDKLYGFGGKIDPLAPFNLLLVMPSAHRMETAIASTWTGHFPSLCLILWFVWTAYHCNVTRCHGEIAPPIPRCSVYGQICFYFLKKNQFLRH